MTDVKTLLDKVDAIKDEDGDSSPRSKSTFAGILVGVVVGLMVGHSRQWNLFYSALGGGVAGAAVGAILVPSTK